MPASSAALRTVPSRLSRTASACVADDLSPREPGEAPDRCEGVERVEGVWRLQPGDTVRHDRVLAEDDQHIEIGCMLGDGGTRLKVGHPETADQHVSRAGPFHESSGEDGPQQRTGHQVEAELLEEEHPFDDTEPTRGLVLGQEPQHVEGRHLLPGPPVHGHVPHGQRWSPGGTARHRTATRCVAVGAGPRPSRTPSPLPTDALEISTY